MDLKPGLKVKNYVLERQLGHGASGEVWKATDGTKSVALKFMNEHLMKSANAQKHRQRLEREIEALRRLKHPNIPELYEYDLDFERPFLVMRYIGGDSYEKLVANGKMVRIPLQRRIDIIGEIAMALHVAHDLGIIHRDLKPANITGTENPYLLDFSVSLDEASIDKTGAGIGTAMYMAVDGPPDTLNDVYGFVLVSYEIIFGKHAIFAPNDPKARGPMAALEALSRIKSKTWNLPSKIPPHELPDELQGVDLLKLDAVFQKGIGDRAERYADPRDFANDLRTVLTSPAIPAPPAVVAPPEEGGTAVDAAAQAAKVPHEGDKPKAPKAFEKTEMFDSSAIQQAIQPPTPAAPLNAPPASKQYEKTEMFDSSALQQALESQKPAAPLNAPPASKQYEKTEMFDSSEIQQALESQKPATPLNAPPASKQYEKTEMFDSSEIQQALESQKPATPLNAPPASKQYEKTEMFDASQVQQAIPPAAKPARVYEKTQMFDASQVQMAIQGTQAPPADLSTSINDETPKTAAKGSGNRNIAVGVGLLVVIVIAVVALLPMLGGGAPAESTPTPEPTASTAAQAAVTDEPTAAATATHTPEPAPDVTEEVPTVRTFAQLALYERCRLSDFDASDSIDETDVALISERLESRAGDENYDPAYDLNADEMINGTDFEIVFAFLGSTCQQVMCEQLDVNTDGQISSSDAGAMIASMGSKAGDAAFVEAYDFNTDAIIDELDLDRIQENLDTDCSAD